MNRMRNILWGLVFVAVGVVFGLNALEITDINLFFDGWWTLFIIVPCTIELFKTHGRLGNLIGVIIGVVLLLVCQDLLDIELMGKLLVPAILVIIGIAFIFKDAFSGQAGKKIKELHKGKSGNKAYFSAFSGQKVDFNGQTFTGTDLSAIFGGVECDLRNAVMNEDAVIDVNAIFGGVDIFVPDYVRVKIRSTSIFGGVSEKGVHDPVGEAPTLYVNAVCLFGGVDIK